MFQVRFYRDVAGIEHARIWLESIPIHSKVKAFSRMKLLAEYGYNLRRPYADYLRDGIFSCQAEEGTIQTI